MWEDLKGGPESRTTFTRRILDDLKRACFYLSQADELEKKAEEYYHNARILRNKAFQIIDLAFKRETKRDQNGNDKPPERTET